METELPLTSLDYAGKPQTRPRPNGRIVDHRDDLNVTLFQRGKDNFAVVYGLQEANKPTCLWLRDIPLLKSTQIVGKGLFYTKKNGARMSRWSHITSGTRKEERAKIASRTFSGIAQAMADQWGNL